VAVVQYTFRHKQYTEQHSSLIRESAGRVPSLRVIPRRVGGPQGRFGRVR